MPIIITSGYKYTDIDALACAVAYCEFLQLQNISSKIILAPFNFSVPKNLKKSSLKISKQFKNIINQKFIIVDVSDPKQLPSFVRPNKVTKIFDHHFGYEKFWEKQLKTDAKIQAVGACATLIWEEYRKLKLTDKISKTSANLLSMAIVSNTLNFKASMTCERDKQAFLELKKLNNFRQNWIKQYFMGRERILFQHLTKAIKSDTKINFVKNLKLNFVIGQIEPWNGKNFILKHQKTIKKALTSYHNPNWFFTCPSISQGVNYIYTENLNIQKLLVKKIGAVFKNNIGITKKLWLRKEILRELQKNSHK